MPQVASDTASTAGTSFSPIDTDPNDGDPCTPTDNDGKYEWYVPDAISKKCLIKVENAANPDEYDISPKSGKYFEIKVAFNIIHPNNGERWVTNETTLC